MKMRRTSVPFSKESCIFCKFPGTDKSSLQAEYKKEVAENIQKCAVDLQDRRLMARLAGDLVAIGAKYHTECYVKTERKRE